MSRQKLIHIHSVAQNSDSNGPKLPTSSQIEYGELAINYLKDNETISIKNNNNEIKSLSLNAPFFFNTNGKGGIESKSANSTGKRGGVGTNSLAEGYSTTASGYASHAEGYSTTASGAYSHSENALNTANGYGSHSEGHSTTASGMYSHSEGELTVAAGACAHVQGGACYANGKYSHAEGSLCVANGEESHAEGWSTFAKGNCSHAEGMKTVSGRSSTNTYSHAEGGYTYAYGMSSHTEGYCTARIGVKGKVTSTTDKTFELYLDETSGYVYFAGNTDLECVWPYITDVTKPLIFTSGERYFYKDWDTLKSDMDKGKRENMISSIASFSPNDATYNSTTKTLTFTMDFSSVDNSTAWDTALFDNFGDEEVFYVDWVLNSLAYNQSSHLEGDFGICGGDRSHCEGYVNLCNGGKSSVGGLGCVNQSNMSLVHGYGLLNHRNSPYSTTIGCFNSPVEGGIFIIGLGSDNNNRKNALTVTSRGLFQTSAAWTTSSDVRLKNVIDDTISVDVNKVAEMPVFTYTRKDLEKSQTMIGSSAQYWQEILPESVKEDENGYLSLDYNGILLSCVKSLAKSVENYKSEIEDLKKEIEELKNK